MSDVRWIKITTDMFDNRKIKAIRKLPEGNNIILIWVMLLSLAGRCNASGMIFLTENIPYTNKMLSDELDFDESIICIAINTLEKFGMISRDENMLISVNNWDEYQNVDGMERIREQTRRRVAECRERKKMRCNNHDNVAKIDSKRCNNDDDNSKLSDVTIIDTSQKHENKRCNNDDYISKNKFSASKSNFENVNIVLNIYPEYQYILDRHKLMKCITDWMEYKDEKKPKTSNHYDSERGIKILLNKFVEYDKKFGTDVVIGVVDYTISNNYQGIVWDRAEKVVKRSGANSRLIKSDGMSIEDQIRLLESNPTSF